MEINTYHKNKVLNQDGQIVLFVVVALTIALMFGVGISLRTLSSVARVTASDTAAKVAAAADGGAERFLGLPYYNLTQVVSGTCPSGTTSLGGACQITFGNSITDPIISQALVTVRAINQDENSENYSTVVPQDDLREINLDGYGDYDLTVCWDNADVNSNWDTDLYYQVYGVEKGAAKIFEKYGVSSDGSYDGPYTKKGFIMETAPGDCDNNSYGFTIDADKLTNAYGLRIRSINGASVVTIIPADGATLPVQKFEITSVGSLYYNGQLAGTKKVVVTRSLPYLPAMFDFALYSEDDY